MNTHRTLIILVAVLGALGSAFTRLSAADPASASNPNQALRGVLKDDHALGADFWVYNNLESAFRAAREQNKPLFVTFRCVPCKACSGFDNHPLTMTPEQFQMHIRLNRNIGDQLPLSILRNGKKLDIVLPLVE